VQPTREAAQLGLSLVELVAGKAQGVGRRCAGAIPSAVNRTSRGERSVRAGRVSKGTMTVLKPP
jgi:hypothetical protein